MILNLLVFLLAAIVWVAALWLAILPQFPHWPDIGVAGAHILPPAVVGMLWAIMRRRTQAKRTSDALAREEQAQAERKAAREAALKKYDDEMLHRRFGCDCRAIAFSRLGLAVSLPAADSSHPNVDIRPAYLDPEEDRQDASILDRLETSIADALCSIYAACRASIAFPVFVVPPSEAAGEDVLARVRAIRAALADALVPQWNQDGIYGPILFLPASDSTTGSVLSLFETASDLPGAVILAFDSPFSRISNDSGDFDDMPDSARIAHEQFVGKPSEAVVAMLMTNVQLPAMLAAMSHTGAADTADSMTPFWEKEIHAGGRLESLARVDPQLRDELSELPVLGRLHRAAIRQHDTARASVLALTRLVQDALEHAQINAGLIDPPFVWSEAPSGDDSQTAKPIENRCGAIVHNAGDVEISGKRLAALGGALYYFGIDISPVDNDAVLNIVTRIGDMGRASGIGQMALGFVYAAQKMAPALYAEFLDSEGLAASFVMPVGAHHNQD